MLFFFFWFRNAKRELIDDLLEKRQKKKNQIVKFWADKDLCACICQLGDGLVSLALYF